jgi:hypothetical protein
MISSQKRVHLDTIKNSMYYIIEVMTNTRLFKIKKSIKYNEVKIKISHINKDSISVVLLYNLQQLINTGITDKRARVEDITINKLGREEAQSLLDTLYDITSYEKNILTRIILEDS